MIRINDIDLQRSAPLIRINVPRPRGDARSHGATSGRPVELSRRPDVVAVPTVERGSDTADTGWPLAITRPKG